MISIFFDCAHCCTDSATGSGIIDSIVLTLRDSRKGKFLATVNDALLGKSRDAYSGRG
jgi:hypothetical protein